MRTPLITVTQVSKAVLTAETPLALLHDINFAIQPGETLALIGPSGSGKSTLLGLLAGLDVPTTGEIYLKGHALSQLTEEQRTQLRGQTLGFIFQSFLLLPHLTALENVLLPAQLIDGTPQPERAKELLASVGLAQRVQHYPSQLSGGEQQRVAIARAFMTNPPLILADEPTGNLDTATGQRISDLLFALNAQHGTTLVIVTHDPQLAQRCQRQLTMEAGHLTELQTVQEPLCQR